jgi:hypothetical protein
VPPRENVKVVGTVADHRLRDFLTRVDAECRLVWRSDRLVDDELEFVATDGDTIHARGFDRGAMREFAIDAGTGERLTTA